MDNDESDPVKDDIISTMNKVLGMFATEEVDPGPCKVEHIKSLEQFIDLTDKDGKCVVDFYTTWCGPCKDIKPLFNQLSLKYENKLQFLVVDIELPKNQAIAKTLKVESIPAFITFHNGQQVDRVNGADEDGLKKIVEKLALLD